MDGVLGMEGSFDCKSAAHCCEHGGLAWTALTLSRNTIGWQWTEMQSTLLVELSYEFRYCSLILQVPECCELFTQSTTANLMLKCNDP